MVKVKYFGNTMLRLGKTKINTIVADHLEPPTLIRHCSCRKNLILRIVTKADIKDFQFRHAGEVTWDHFARAFLNFGYSVLGGNNQYSGLWCMHPAQHTRPGCPKISNY